VPSPVVVLVVVRRRVLKLLRPLDRHQGEHALLDATHVTRRLPRPMQASSPAAGVESRGYPWS